MVSYEDVLLRIRGQDNTGGAFGSAQQRVGALKTAVGGAVTAMSASMLSYAKSAVDSAMTAEQEWNKFSNAVDKNGGNWDKQSDEIKKWVRDYSNEMGRSVADTRAAMTTYMSMGMSFKDSQDAMKATSNYAAQMGLSQEQAAGQLQKAFMGNGKALKSLGLDIKDYKDETTGAVDKQKLLTDILSRTGGAADKYADSSTAKFQRLNNVLAGLKTDFGAAIMDAITPLIPVVQGFLDVINNLPGPVKSVGFAAIALGAGIGIIAGPLMSVIGLMETLGFTLPTIGGLLGALGGETAALTGEELALAAAQAGLSAEELGAAAAHATNGIALEAEGLAATTASGGFWSMAAAELAALWPILAIAAAVGAFVVIVEQIGESLGWWTDFSTMLDAIQAGVQRLWSAFMNSPQVQGAIAAVRNAVSQLWSFVKPIFDWIGAAWNNLFKSEGAGSGGPDVVGQIINFFGQLGSIASQVFGVLQQGFTVVFSVISPLWVMLSNLVTIFSSLMNGSMSWQDAIISAITTIISGLGGFSTRVGQVALQIGRAILNSIINAVRPLPGRIWQFLTQAITRFINFRTRVATIAVQAGLRILQGIVNRVRQIPGQVGTFMMRVPGRIASAAGSAVGAAVSLASGVVTAVRNGIMGIADTVYNEFMNIPSRINSAVSDAVSAAANFGSGIKDAVLNALHIASPGIIQRKIAIEFQDIPGRIGESNRYVYSAARDYAGNILKGFNAPQMSLPTVNSIRENANYTPNSTSNGNTTIVHVHENAMPLNAHNLTAKEATSVVITALETLSDDPAGV
ncbi:MAG: hypothetical protein IJ258_05730 [Methanobrevibacter sp.]|uniref:phage tail protein n=1 Tax=Methanobrevibacter sp. TaxID=66852 RepID=UPI0025D4A568|nr:hypothetical protein [Methanobrevibacter sp.]MBQ8017592.1 hypothetical protein [Methanobrevibacter sp.]